MGLAGPKANTKISKDPRNTFWSKDTSRFGHQYLANLGWVPGQNLGDTTSSYHTSGHITDASSTGIKIVLKDDTLGIGAKKSAQSDECTGLLGLQGLLGRLNGNDKMVEQVKLEEDRKKNEWIESRWGMRFVRGEVWVADDLTKLRERMVKEREGKSEALKAKEEKEKGKGAEEKSSSSRKKRKRDTDDGEKDKKESKKSKSRDKKKKSKQRDPEGDGAATPATDRESKSTSASGDETESKEERRRRRNEEKRLKNERKENRGAQKKEKKEKKERKKKRKASSDSDSSSESETEPASGSVTPASAMNGRHALRHRFIAAKRSAMMDAASLNEILMIKA